MSLPNLHDAIPENIHKAGATRVCDGVWGLGLGNLCSNQVLLNLRKLNGLPQPNQFDESTFSFRGIRSDTIA